MQSNDFFAPSSDVVGVPLTDEYLLMTSGYVDIATR